MQLTKETKKAIEYKKKNSALVAIKNWKLK